MSANAHAEDGNGVLQEPIEPRGDDCTASMCPCDTAILTVCVRSATHSRGGRFRLEWVTTIEEEEELTSGRAVRGYLPPRRPSWVRKITIHDASVYSSSNPPRRSRR